MSEMFTQSRILNQASGIWTRTNNFNRKNRDNQTACLDEHQLCRKNLIDKDWTKIDFYKCHSLTFGVDTGSMNLIKQEINKK